MKFGDRLAGCRWHKMSQLIVGDGAWFVGHCIVSPINVKPKAMLLPGGVAVKDMEENHIYAGSPAQDVSDKMGFQFDNISLKEKEVIFSSYINEYSKLGRSVDFIKTTSNLCGKDRSKDYTFYDLDDQRYIPRYTMEEYQFMRFLLYDKAKFIPA
jgi:hypothetical protein